MDKAIAFLMAGALLMIIPVVGADHGEDSNGRACATDGGAIAIGPYYLSSGGFVYEESNNVAGLQDGSDTSPVLGDSDNGDCTHPDTLIL